MITSRLPKLLIYITKVVSAKTKYSPTFIDSTFLKLSDKTNNNKNNYDYGGNSG